MSKQYLWKVFCINGGVYETTVSATAPTVCPSDGGPINADLTTVLAEKFVELNTTGPVNIQSSLADALAVKLNASNTAGGVNIVAGSNGVAVDATGTIAIGNGSSGSVINVGNASSAKTVVLGNSHADSKMCIRWGSAGLITHREAHLALPNANTTLTLSNLLNGIITMAPSGTKILTLMSAANAVAGLSGVAVNDAISFYIIDQSGGNINLVAGTGGTIVGRISLSGNDSAHFQLRFTNVSSGTEAYVVYRLA